MFPISKVRYQEASTLHASVPATADGNPKTGATSTPRIRVLCIGNGGVVYRDGQLWTQRCLAGFLTEMGKLAGEICYCAWRLKPNEDALSQAVLDNVPGVRVVALPRVDGSFQAKTINGLSSFAILVREIFRAEFVYLYWPGRIASITARLCRIIGKPYGIYFRGEQIPPDSTFGVAFKHARFVLTTGQQLRTIAEAHCGDVENVTPMTSLRPAHIVPPREPRRLGPWQLLYVGRLEERKGICDLLGALSYLEEMGIPVVLTMVGHCYIPDLLRHLTPSVARCVRAVDSVSDFERLLSYYRAADIFVFPSHDEGFPRVLYEAMASGLPIITTFVGSVASVMEDGRNCLRIQVKEPRDIANKIRDLVSDTEVQSRISSAGNQTICELMATWQRSHAVQVIERLTGC